MNIPPNIITTLVGGPCDGQMVSEHLFDGRTEINAFKQTPAQVTPIDEAVDIPRNDVSHRYVLREGRYPRGGGFVVFAYPEMPDVDVFHACERLRKLPPPEWFCDMA